MTFKDKRTPEDIGAETRTMSVLDFYHKWHGRTNPRKPTEDGFREWVSDLFAVRRGGAEEALGIAALRRSKPPFSPTAAEAIDKYNALKKRRGNASS